MIRPIFFAFVLGSAIPAWGNTSLVSDLEGNHIGQTRDSRSECDDLFEEHQANKGLSVLPKGWTRCVEMVRAHNQHLYLKRDQANESIRAKRKNQANSALDADKKSATGSKSRSLQDELVETKATAKQLLTGDGILSSGGQPNTVGSAAARAALVGERTTNMATSQLDSFKRLFDEVSQPVAAPAASGSYRSGFDSIGGAPSGATTGQPSVFQQYQVNEQAERRRVVEAQRATQEQQRIAEAQRVANEQQWAQDKLRRQAEWEEYVAQIQKKRARQRSRDAALQGSMNSAIQAYGTSKRSKTGCNSAGQCFVSESD